MKAFKPMLAESLTQLQQPEAGRLISELRHLLGFTQMELATELGVAFTTINRWENKHIQPSSLGLKQVRAVLVELSQSSELHLRQGSEQLLNQYFLGSKL